MGGSDTDETEPRKAKTLKGPTSRVALAALAVATPNFLASTSAASAPAGIVNELALCTVVASTLCMALRPPRLPRRAALALGFVPPTLLIGLQLACLAFRDAIPSWHYVSAQDAAALVDQALRALTAICCAASTLSELSAHDGAEPSSALMGPLLLCLFAGVFWYGFSWVGPELSGPLAEGLSANALSVLAWLVTALCYLPIAFVALGLGSRLPAWLTVASFAGGALVANAILRFADALALGAFSDGLVFGEFSGIALALAALVLSILALLWAKRHETTGTDGAHGQSESHDRDFLAVALGRLPGSEVLSLREREVLLLDLAGEKTAAVAEKLGISRSSIGTHRERAYEKLAVASRQELLGLLLDQAGAEGDEEAPSGPAPHDVGRGARRLVEGALAPLAVALGALACSLGLPTWFASWVVLLVSCALLLSGLALATARAHDLGDSDAHRLSTLFGAIALTGSLAALSRASPDEGMAASLLALCLGWATLRGRFRDAFAGSPLALALGGCAGLTAALPASPHSMTRQCTILALLACAALALRMRQLEAAQERSDLADCVLVGRERVRSYLMGRGLSELESDVALLAALGFDSESTARRLHASPHTVASYRSRAYDRLGVKDRAGLRALLRREADLQ